MKFSALILITFLAGQTFAAEAVTFKADMAVTRCANDEICGAEFGDAQNITVLLQETKDSNLLKGRHEFMNKVDNYEFRGILDAYKYSLGGHSRYMIQTLIGVSKNDKFLGYYVLGAVTIKGMNLLNDISWLSPKILDEKFHYFVRMSVAAQE